MEVPDHDDREEQNEPVEYGVWYAELQENVVEETVGAGDLVVPVGCYRVALEQGDKEDGNTPRAGEGHDGEDGVSKGLSDTEETEVEEQNGHFDGNDGERVENFVAPVQLDFDLV